MASDIIETTVGLTFPPSVDDLIRGNPDLESFILTNRSPLGPIPLGVETNFVLAAEIDEGVQNVLDGLGRIACQSLREQTTRYGAIVVGYETAVGHQVYTTVIRHAVRGQQNGRGASVLRAGDFLFGFLHTFPGQTVNGQRSNLTLDDSVKRAIGIVGPLDEVNVTFLNRLAQKKDAGT
jgi:hypothetical protein